MNQTLLIIIMLMTSYLIGSIPFSFILGKLWGKDIRKEGSGNIGATNVLRSCGKVPGALAYFLDIAKGVLAWWLTQFIYTKGGSTPPHYLIVIASCMAVVGHSRSVFLGFKGGKGVATAAGIMLCLIPLPLLFTLVVFFSVFLPSRIISLSSMTASVFLPILLWLHVRYAYAMPGFLQMTSRTEAESFAVMLIITILLALFIITRHRANIGRLLRGEEHSFKK